MSLDTWKQEFYPVPASEVENDQVAATEHSLRKWRGLTTENLTRHDLACTPPEIYDANPGKTHDYFCFGEYTCALCRHYFKSPDDDTPTCVTCPLYETLQGHTCDYDGQPYSVWIRTGDPQPMITALEETLEHLTKE